nr:hypothetical protein 14 [bacterium]
MASRYPKMESEKPSPKRSTRRPFTQEVQERFLIELINCAGNMTLASELVGISRETVRRHKNENPEFSKAYAAAQQEALTALEDEARRRAVNGVEKPVFHKGEVCGYVKEYSDTLLIVLLKAHMPEKYKERHQVDLEAGEKLVEWLDDVNTRNGGGEEGA